MTYESLSSLLRETSETGTVVRMMTDPATLRGFLFDKMRETGMSQTDIAKRSGLSISDINGIVQGRIKLPGPDKRRKLARALGVSHLDILIAAGEITESEVEAVDVQGVTHDDPIRSELIDKLQTVRLTDERTETIEDILDRWIRRDRNASEYVQHSPRQSNEFNIS